MTLRYTLKEAPKRPLSPAERFHDHVLDCKRCEAANGFLTLCKSGVTLFERAIGRKEAA